MTNPQPGAGSLSLGRTLGPFTALLFLVLWGVAFFPYNDLLDRQGTPLGGDYVMFYLGGQIAADAPQLLYDQQEHCRRLRQQFPALGDGDLLPYRYPPYVAAAFAPLSRLPFLVSFAAFFALSMSLWLAALSLLSREWPDYFAMPAGQGLWWGALGWPVALETLAGGQASMLALLIALAGMLLLRRQQPIAAGAVLALALYKPNVLALFILGCALKYPRLLLGFLPVAVTLGTFGVVALGWETTLTYATLGQQLASQTWQTPTPFWKVHGLASWVESVPGAKLLVLSLGVALVAGAYWSISGRKATANENPSQDRYFAVLLVINALCNPYPPVYDLVLLLLPLVLLAVHFERTQSPAGRWLPLLSAALFFGPHFSQALAFQVHGQVFTLILLAWAAWLISMLRGDERAAPASGRDAEFGQGIPAPELRQAVPENPPPHYN